MASCSVEPGRTKPYSEEIRWRIVWQREVLGYNLRKVAGNLGVAINTVWRITELFYNTGSVKKCSYRSCEQTTNKETD